MVKTLRKKTKKWIFEPSRKGDPDLNRRRSKRENIQESNFDSHRRHHYSIIELELFGKR